MATQFNDYKPGLREKWPVPHLQETYSTWVKVHKLVDQGSLVIDGYNLDIATLVALVRFVNEISYFQGTDDLTPGRHGCLPTIDKSSAVIKRVEDSVSTLQGYLSKGYFLYGKSHDMTAYVDMRSH